VLFWSAGVKEIRNRIIEGLGAIVILVTVAGYAVDLLDWLKGGRTTPQLWAYTVAIGVFVLVVTVVVCVYRCSILSSMAAKLEADNDSLEKAILANVRKEERN